MGLFNAIQQIADTVNSVPTSADPSDVETVQHSKYHRRIVVVAGCFAVIGLIVGLLSSAVMVGEVKSGKDIRGLFLVPVMYGAGGFMLGMSLMCATASRTFLTGPIGRPWMRLIGTESVLMARIVCFLFGLIVTAPLVGIGLLIALGD